jgi:hypothetical protein
MDNLTQIILIAVVAFLLLGCTCKCSGVEGFGRNKAARRTIRRAFMIADRRAKKAARLNLKRRKKAARLNLKRRRKATSSNLNRRKKATSSNLNREKKAGSDKKYMFSGCNKGKYMDSISKSCRSFSVKGRENPGQVLSHHKCREWCNIKNCKECISPYGYCGSTLNHCKQSSTCRC